MVVTCPDCGGIYSVKRVSVRTIQDDMQKWDKGMKTGQDKKEIDQFYCKDCGSTFHSDGKTRMETDKFP